MTQIHLLGLCGALRSGSTNRLLLHEAARLFGPATFAEASLRLPLYDGDVEAQHGIPQEVQDLAQQIIAADAVLIAGPEYNKGISGVFKNALDWLSRGNQRPWAGKPVAIMSAAAGRAGGERMQVMLRSCLNPFQPRVLPGPEVMIAASDQAFDAAGQLKDPRSTETLSALMARLRDEIALARAAQP